MSLINQALKKAQQQSQEQMAEDSTPEKPHSLDPQTQSLHWDRTSKKRWYLVALLLGPALIFPVISSKWTRDKRHYREEIDILVHSPVRPASKYDFGEKNEGSPHSVATENLTSTSTPTHQGSRSLAKNTPDPSITKFVNQSRISSIRAAGKNSKIVINNRTVTIDSYIEEGFPVRVSKVSPNEIVFVDDGGYEYYKRL